MPKRNKGPTVTDLLSAIRKKCMDCSGQMRSEVQNCKIKNCPLHSFRRNAVDQEDQIQFDMQEIGI